MTVAEWEVSEAVLCMLAFLRRRGSASMRKLRLFAAACCRRVWGRLKKPTDRAAVAVLEEYADGLASPAALTAARRAADESCDRNHMEAYWACNRGHWEAARMAAHTTSPPTYREGHDLLRDVINIRPVALDPAWLATDFRSLAQAAYDERLLPSGHLDAVRLGVLADALEEAGATGDLVAHLRSPGPHVRGCWAVDLLLGKA